eukprot:CAMPEP_0119417662 /NCGR_PEP_ID=MMETSP1335-20130426/16360_1 /TAXON_ID=259385 /ORGANISM="Chrysoculter rhomboideus, Strain RCC1486" /LENGTH=138 /DNA_ID=CAMNT_0007442855 /DNA_START=409 /DNA_END=821 /DNA_ORIENTATION=-
MERPSRDISIETSCSYDTSLGVVDHLHRLGVACGRRAHRLVRRLLDLTLRVAHSRRDHAGDALVRQLDAPEAATSERGDAVAIAALSWDDARERVLSRLRAPRRWPAGERGVIDGRHGVAKDGRQNVHAHARTRHHMP